MADFATSGGTETADFARTVGREVVVQHEPLGGLAARHRVELLRILLRAERHRRKGLGLAARKDRAAVQTRQNADLRRKRTDLVLGAAVDAQPLLQHVLAHGLDLERIEKVHETDRVDFRPLLGDLLEEVFLDDRDLALALQLALDEQGRRESLAAFLAHEVHLVRRLGDVLDHLVRLAQRAAHFELEVNDLDDLLMRTLERGDEVLIADFGGGTFHHQELVAQPRVQEVDVALRLLLVGRIDHPLSVDAADAHAPDRTHERNLADVQRRGRGVHRQKVRLARAVGLDQRRIDLHIVVVPLREERADRPVAHARGQDFLARRARLALEESAGELARRVELLAVFALQREEIDPFPRRIRIRDRREDGRVTVRNGDGPCRLLRQKPGLDHEVRPRDVDLELLCTLHLFVFSFSVCKGNAGRRPRPPLSGGCRAWR